MLGQAAPPPTTSYEYETSGAARYTHEVVMGICNAQCDDREGQVLAYCMELDLIPATMLCPNCCGSMTIMRRGKATHSWRCMKRSCDKYLSVRAGTIFEAAKKPLSKLVQVLFYIANDTPSSKVKKFTTMGSATMSEWYAICRGYCSKEMLRVDMKVGGPGHVVEIDETSLAKKQKYHRGMKYAEFWLFGGFDRMSKKRFAAITFDNHTKETLTSVIAETILPHTHIISDMFASYVSTGGRHTLANNPKLRHLSYMHTWVNHSKHFKDPKTAAHTNGIEGCWEAKIKSRIKQMRGLDSMEKVAAVVDECLWRSWFFQPDASAEVLFKGLVTAIKRHPGK